MLVEIDFESEKPIYQQIRNQIVIGIASGEIKEGERLPTVRSLADDLGVNMMTVSKAYQLLKQEGYIYGDRRQGALVRKSVKSEKKLQELSGDTLKSFKIIISEAKLHGVSFEELIDFCKSEYENGDE